MTKLALDTETNGFTATVEHDSHGADESPREWAMESVFFGFHRSFASPDPAPCGSCSTVAVNPLVSVSSASFVIGSILIALFLACLISGQVASLGQTPTQPWASVST